MAGYLRRGEFRNLHLSEMNGKTDEYKPKNPPGTKLFYSGMVDFETLCFTFSRPTDYGLVNVPIYVPVGKNSEDLCEPFHAGGLEYHISKYSPEEVLITGPIPQHESE